MQPTPPAQDEGRGVDLARVRATILASRAREVAPPTTTAISRRSLRTAEAARLNPDARV